MKNATHRRPSTDYHDYLLSVPLFSRCNKAELKSLARRTTDITAQPGQVLITEGSGSHEFFVIVSGEAEVSRHGEVVARLEAGRWFGELGLLDAALRDATVTAVTPMELIVLSQWEFEEALGEAPAMTRRLLAGMAHRLRELDQQG
ncbi:MAG TPA: cyclic nucleotide-binding domain-containing protein [Acidimicrobiia bacterium]|nr:cyclic nucleotide-binding domain-containing protein [Acidimicrobiia bacterium]